MLRRSIFMLHRTGTVSRRSRSGFHGRRGTLVRVPPRPVSPAQEGPKALHRPRINLADLVRQRSFQAAATRTAAPHLTEVQDFGPNPGALRMLSFVPEGLPEGAPLVVALHGCTQNAAGYDRGCGWSDLARQLGFALLLPEQRQANNPNRCFNWFEPGDTARDAGEAASIRQMVAHMLAAHRLDPRRVFVTGLSAGGRHDLGDAGHLSGGLRRRRHHRRPAARRGLQHAGSLRGDGQWPAAAGAGLGRSGPRRLAASRSLAARLGLAGRGGQHGAAGECRADPAAMDRPARPFRRPGAGAHGRRPSPPGLARCGRHDPAGEPQHRRHGAWRPHSSRRGRAARWHGGALHPGCRDLLHPPDRRLLRPRRCPGGSGHVGAQHGTGGDHRDRPRWRGAAWGKGGAPRRCQAAGGSRSAGLRSRQGDPAGARSGGAAQILI
ncbi:PHB depolymerase family esterase [Siccirubricoccus sp. G192]|nr:PHB depolymerase family esterase [Siccirubricoccus sp. G192]